MQNPLCPSAKIITLRAIALKLPCFVSWWLCIDRAKIITLRAIALKPVPRSKLTNSMPAKIITLRAIALKLESRRNSELEVLRGEDHNATSYSTETSRQMHSSTQRKYAKIITLRAIALKPEECKESIGRVRAKIITLRAIALKHCKRLDYSSPALRRS